MYALVKSVCVYVYACMIILSPHLLRHLACMFVFCALMIWLIFAYYHSPSLIPLFWLGSVIECNNDLAYFYCEKVSAFVHV